MWPTFICSSLRFSSPYCLSSCELCSSSKLCPNLQPFKSPPWKLHSLSRWNLQIWICWHCAFAQPCWVQWSSHSSSLVNTEATGGKWSAWDREKAHVCLESIPDKPPFFWTRFLRGRYWSILVFSWSWLTLPPADPNKTKINNRNSRYRPNTIRFFSKLPFSGHFEDLC